MQKIVLIEQDENIVDIFNTLFLKKEIEDITLIHVQNEHELKSINTDTNIIYLCNANCLNILESISTSIFIYGGDGTIYANCDMQFLLNLTDYTLEKNIDIILKNIIHYASTFKKLLLVSTVLNDVIKFDNIFSYNITTRGLYKDTIFVKNLTNKEGTILEILLTNYGKVVSKQYILETIWGKSEYYTSRCMDVYVSKLRSYLKFIGVTSIIKSVTGKTPGLIFIPN